MHETCFEIMLFYEAGISLHEIFILTHEMKKKKRTNLLLHDFVFNLTPQVLWE